jgi:septal ring factor EnvC (AmiA/AmiB activator)
MKKYIIALIGFVMLLLSVSAQPAASKEQQELERQRQQIKKEIEQAQELLDNNRKTTKENMSTLAIINHKLNKQENVIENISREINLMDNNIYKSQKDVNKLQLVLDTLKEEYTRSMLYAYKSRSSSDFLNFVFSSPSFNDAIKRINYLKSYRSYREMQGENIARTQVLLKDRIDELSGNKQKKNVVLQIQSKEVDALQVQQEEKNLIVSKLKAKGKELNNQIAAKKKQMQKVNNAFAAAIKRANDEARKIAAATKVYEDRNRRELDLDNKKNNTTTNTKTGKKNRAVTEPTNTKSVFLGIDAELSLNTNFERNKGNLPWPVNSGYLLLHYGLNKLGNGVEVISEGLSIGTAIGTAVKAIFDGEVKAVDNYDDLQMVVIKHGMYFTGYSNISGVNLKKGQMVNVGQVIGKVAANLDGVGAIDLMISKDKSELNPEAWLKRR